MSTNTTRFCAACQTDVEDVGGYCLLGHSLRVASVIQTAVELRNEVHAAFDSARDEVRALIPTGLVESSDATPSHGPPGDRGTDQPLSSGMVSLFTPQEPAVERRSFSSVWEGLEQRESRSATDPIEAFAPPPAMDWGPERNPLKKRFGLRRPRLQEAAGQ